MLGLLALSELRKLGEDFDAARRQPDTVARAASLADCEVGRDRDQGSFGSGHISIKSSEVSALAIWLEAQRTADVMSKVKSDTIASKSANL